ncbi:membrane protein, putative [Brugia malayi]|uniref:Bm10755 n=1 Tax=Brugia malayi TaxID=6279 RepID=A0A0K0IPD3_BRUMA|nr:uncharacterized protein BM_BM10755 [Brugia malayi]CDP99431.1 Bm10755 [Brugia malayi]VIO99879.1 membrane protein, putative [Brugia malayi]
MPFPRYISADYFGPKPITIGVHFPIGHNASFPGDGEIIDPDTGETNYVFQHNQVVKWKDTGLEANGDDLIVQANGVWTFWSNNNKRESQHSYTLQSLEQLKHATRFEGGQGDNSLSNFHLIYNDYKPSTPQNISNNLNASCTVSCNCINKDGTVSRGALR